MRLQDGTTHYFNNIIHKIDIKSIEKYYHRKYKNISFSLLGFLFAEGSDIINIDFVLGGHYGITQIHHYN